MNANIAQMHMGLWDSRRGHLLNLGASGKKGFLKEMTSELDSEGRVGGKTKEQSRQRTPL